MMKKLVALSLVAMLTSNVFAADVEQENVKKAAAEVAEKTVALKAAGLSNAEVMAAMEQEISNMTGDAQPAVAVKSKTKKYVLIGAVVAALVACGYYGYNKGWFKKAVAAPAPTATVTLPTTTSVATTPVTAPIATATVPATTPVIATPATVATVVATPASTATAATATTAATAPTVTATVAAPKV